MHDFEILEYDCVSPKKRSSGKLELQFRKGGTLKQ